MPRASDQRRRVPHQDPGPGPPQTPHPGSGRSWTGFPSWTSPAACPAAVAAAAPEPGAPSPPHQLAPTEDEQDPEHTKTGQLGPNTR